MAANGLKLIYGGAAFIKGVTLEGVTEWLTTLESLNITGIDTAQGYGASEELLGKAGAPSRFTIDTKQSSGFGGPPSTKEWVVESGKASLEKLQTDSVSGIPQQSITSNLANSLRSTFTTSTPQTVECP